MQPSNMVPGLKKLPLFRQSASTLLASFLGAYVFLDKCASVTIVKGNSMYPTLQNENKLCVVKFGEFGKGDVVVVKDPGDNDRLLVKRVTASAGETVKNSHGHDVVVPRGHMWVEGDNSANSLDSRTFGSIPIGLVESRVLGVMWPPRDMRLLGRSYELDQHSNTTNAWHSMFSPVGAFKKLFASVKSAASLASSSSSSSLSTGSKGTSASAFSWFASFQSNPAPVVVVEHKGQDTPRC